jgi:FAD/FMN-containing dehydrogenase
VDVVENFSRNPKTKSWVKHIRWSCDPLPESADNGTLIPFGLDGSFGAVCLNDGDPVVVTPGMNRIIGFDAATSLIRCEAGGTLDAILRFAVPRSGTNFLAF